MKKTGFALLSSSLLAATMMSGNFPVAQAQTLQTSTVHASTVNASQVTDLAGSAFIQTQTSGPIDTQFSNLETQYDVPLTSVSSWHGFCRQNARDITVNLPSNADIHTISIQLEQNASFGVFYPSHVDFQAEVNGQWYNVGSRESVVPLTDKRLTTQTFQVNLTGLETNRVRIHFPVGVWVFARRLRVLGVPDAGSVQTAPSRSTVISSGISTSQTSSYGGNRGIQNMLLAYTGAYGAQGTWSPSDFAPMIGYTSPIGIVSRPMFDTILFTPYGLLQDTQSSWQGYLSDLFTRGQQLDALNTAVGQVAAKMGQYHKEKVVLTIPYPSFGDGDWGTINGQTINFDPTSTDSAGLIDREQALHWYIQTIINDWNAQGYQNLELTGLYWAQETVQYSSPGEVAMIQDTANYVHQRGYGFYWIPFYDARGLTDWRSFGFDYAWLQPNYSEQGSSADIYRILDAAQYAKDNGLGMELELVGMVDDPQVQASYNQNIQQLETAGVSGSNMSHAYYAGSKELVQSFNATDTGTHNLYADTYQFMQQQ